jgi:hypothetical protein
MGKIGSRTRIIGVALGKFAKPAPILVDLPPIWGGIFSLGRFNNWGKIENFNLSIDSP